MNRNRHFLNYRTHEVAYIFSQSLPRMKSLAFKGRWRGAVKNMAMAGTGGCSQGTAPWNFFWSIQINSQNFHYGISWAVISENIQIKISYSVIQNIKLWIYINHAYTKNFPSNSAKVLSYWRVQFHQWVDQHAATVTLQFGAVHLEKVHQTIFQQDIDFVFIIF